MSEKDWRLALEGNPVWEAARLRQDALEERVASLTRDAHLGAEARGLLSRIDAGDVLPCAECGRDPDYTVPGMMVEEHLGLAADYVPGELGPGCAVGGSVGTCGWNARQFLAAVRRETEGERP